MSCLAGFPPLNYFHAGIDPTGISWESPGLFHVIVTILNFHLRQKKHAFVFIFLLFTAFGVVALKSRCFRQKGGLREEYTCLV